MKIAFYIEDGLEQIVLTPETDSEKNILSKIHDGTRSLDIQRGDFYACRGGWIRHGEWSSLGHVSTTDQLNEKSTIIVLRETPPKDGGE